MKNDSVDLLPYTTKILEVLKHPPLGEWVTHYELSERAYWAGKAGPFDHKLHDRALKSLIVSGIVERKWTVFGRLYKLGAGRYA